MREVQLPAVKSIDNVNIINEMTVITDLKPGWWPLFAMRLVLGAVSLIARYGIRPIGGIATIHFFRWVIIDDGKRLLFTSNYDGSWENYLDEFVDKTWLAMDLVWGNCVGWPKGGARDIESFKAYVKAHQIDANAFYRAYPNDTVRNINNNIAVRSSIQSLLSQKEVEEFLKRL